MASSEVAAKAISQTMVEVLTSTTRTIRSRARNGCRRNLVRVAQARRLPLACGHNSTLIFHLTREAGTRME